MEVVVIGLGSMGKRRIRLLRELYPDSGIYGVDGRADRRQEAEDQFSISCFSSLEEVPMTAECAFVCTSPLSHSDIISACLNKEWHVFTELNLVAEGYEKNTALAKEKQKILFLSSTFLYREEISYIRSRVDQSVPWNYSYHIGQYLPDWHPWESYQDFFLSDPRTNGCREILAIELPWLVTTFGEVAATHVIADKNTDLHINYNDNYMIQLLHKNGSKGSLLVDVVSPCAVRKLEIYREGRYLSWEGTPDSLCEYCPETQELQPVILQEAAEHREGYRAFVVENAYRTEIKEFFSIVAGQKEMVYGFAQDRKILNLIDELGA